MVSFKGVRIRFRYEQRIRYERRIRYEQRSDEETKLGIIREKKTTPYILDPKVLGMLHSHPKLRRHWEKSMGFGVPAWRDPASGEAMSEAHFGSESGASIRLDGIRPLSGRTAARFDISSIQTHAREGFF